MWWKLKSKLLWNPVTILSYTISLCNVKAEVHSVDSILFGRTILFTGVSYSPISTVTATGAFLQYLLVRSSITVARNNKIVSGFIHGE